MIVDTMTGQLNMSIIPTEGSSSNNISDTGRLVLSQIDGTLWEHFTDSCKQDKSERSRAL